MINMPHHDNDGRADDLALGIILAQKCFEFCANRLLVFTLIALLYRRRETQFFCNNCGSLIINPLVHRAHDAVLHELSDDARHRQAKNLREVLNDDDTGNFDCLLCCCRFWSHIRRSA